MKIAILGIGSIGSYVTYLLSKQNDLELHLLARSNYDALNKNGIKISSKDIVPSDSDNKEERQETVDFIPRDRFKLYSKIAEMPQCDAVILCVNANQNHALLPHLAKLSSNNTRFITLQNGLDFEKSLANALSNHPLYSGTCWIKVSAAEPGHVKHEFGNNIKLGRYSTNSSAVTLDHEEANFLTKLFNEEQFSLDLINNIKSVQLTKLALNVPFFTLVARNGVSVSEILDANHMELNKEREAIQAEIINAAKQFGSPVDKQFIEKIVGNLRKMPSTPPGDREQTKERMTADLPGNAGALIDLFHANDIQLEKLEAIYHSLLKH